ncbi:MAG: HAMP domain-containing histidine kinase [Opitutaceae bacterium]|nr:HAMP domain-containing histidine kinase [Opitutaceae bacterium]
MFERLRQSLALRLAIQYALVFAVSAAVLFGALYWVLADALEKREIEAVSRRAEVYAAAYDFGGVASLNNHLNADRSPDQPAYFVRLVNADGSFQWIAVPRNWVETQIEKVPVGVFTWTRETHLVRQPQNALRDYAIASRQLRDGRLLQVGRLTDSLSVLLSPLRRAFGVVGAGALLLSVVVGTLLSWRATKPLRAVSDTTRRILATGDLSARVPGPDGSGELAVLVRQLNTLLEKNAVHVRVLREMLDNLAHDLRTPLTRLRGTAELAIQDSGDPADARAALADCVNESDRVLHLLETLLDISAAEAGVLKLNCDRIDVRSLTERAVDLYREVAEEKTLAVTLDQPDPVEVSADAIRLGQVVNNLLDNALKYTPAGGRVTLAARNEPKTAVITVTDNGPGVPAGEREAIFRRLYRGDSSRSQRGLGLGLSMVKAIVEAHGGTVAVDDAPGGGARFTVRLPR